MAMVLCDDGCRGGGPAVVDVVAVVVNKESLGCEAAAQPWMQCVQSVVHSPETESASGACASWGSGEDVSEEEEEGTRARHWTPRRRRKMKMPTQWQWKSSS